MKANYLFTIMVLFFSFSCTIEEDMKISDTDEVYLSDTQLQSMTKLGRQLENPYTVTNMQIAWDSLMDDQSSGRNESIDITTTHYYVKFSPLDDTEFEIIKDDTTLTLYDYPLDYEISNLGDFYHDPNVPITQPTPQYCAVSVYYEFPSNVSYEILEELFIPDDYSDNQSNGRQESNSLITALVNKSLVLTGNLEESAGNQEEDSSSGRIASSNWRPAGVIKVWDDNMGTTRTSREVVDYYECYNCSTGVIEACDNSNPFTARVNQCRRTVYKTVQETENGSFVPLQGIEVRARRWFTTHKGYTNSLGAYSCDGTFSGNANYSFKWERYHFVIRDGFLSAAEHDGPNTQGNWNVSIRDQKKEFYATIFRASYRYFYQDIKHLRRPPLNGAFNIQMKIRAHNEADADNIANHKEERRFLGLDSQINIWNPQRSTRALYATTIHELAHAAHWNMHRDGNDFDDTDRKVKESWARGVEWELTRIEYLDYQGGSTSRPNYTQLVVDLIDTNGDSNNGSEISSEDNVTGYTIREIEDALQGKKTWASWRESIIEKYENETETNVDALFIHWD